MARCSRSQQRRSCWLALTPSTPQRWHTTLADQADIAPAVLLKILFVGWFFNQVLPTAVGGDVARAWRYHQLGVMGSAIRSVLLDRVCAGLRC
jgi:uncharacterized membrane protein YbhN (UPF0104 family)